MSTLTRMTMQLMGLLTPKSPTGESMVSIDLPSPIISGGLPLMEALSLRKSEREFRPQPLPYQTVSNLLWAAFGINRSDSGRRTAPSAIDCQEIDIYVALPSGTYSYEPRSHSLQLVVPLDVRGITGYQDFVADAPLDLVYVANGRRAALISPTQREIFASASAGAIAQNVYLYCASEGLSTVIRAWISRKELAKALNLESHGQILFSQTVGYPKDVKRSVGQRRPPQT